MHVSHDVKRSHENAPSERPPRGGPLSSGWKHDTEQNAARNKLKIESFMTQS